MNSLRKIYENLPWTIRNYLFCKKGILDIKTYIKNRKALNKAYNNSLLNEKILLIDNHVAKKWYKSFKKFLLAQPADLEVATAFFTDKISKVNIVSCERHNEAKKVILVCVVKNEIYRMKKLLEHYRGLGIEHFVILDNNSDDGTNIFLSEQQDVDLYQVKVPYTSRRKEAWVNQLVALYGEDRWYLYVDSDELLSYIGCEEHKITELVEWCENKHINRLPSFVLDMYSDQQLFNANEGDIYEQYCYFDGEGYSIEEAIMSPKIFGGPRERVFKDHELLSRFSLIYFKEGDVQGKSHYPFPYGSNHNNPYVLALRHYKFLPDDLAVYQNIVKEGNYFNGSSTYKKYLSIYNNNKKTTFIYKNSVKYKSSKSLAQINKSKGGMIGNIFMDTEKL